MTTTPPDPTTDTPEQALKLLPPNLIATLASMHGTTTAIVKATVQLLPPGSRAALVDAGLATESPTTARGNGLRRIKPTPLAFDVITLAADLARPSAETEDETLWAVRAPDSTSTLVDTPMMSKKIADLVAAFIGGHLAAHGARTETLATAVPWTGTKAEHAAAIGERLDS